MKIDKIELSEEFSKLKLSISSAELPTAKIKISNRQSNNNEVLKWNPFEDPTPFNQMTEDHIYEAEFDTLRDRPIGNSNFISLIQKVNSSLRYFIISSTKSK